MQAYHNRPDPARAGNAILIAMAVVAMLVSLVAISTDRAVASVQGTRRGLDQQRVVAAVEAVLARRELMVVQLGNRGDPTEFSRWRENFGIENYGVDFLGDCEVRWKIEPVRTPDKTETGVPNVPGEDIPYIENPSPGAASLLSGKQLANDYIYLFRIGAEARINGTQKDASGEVAPIARAQGVRYASVSKQPLFRYVIFYAQNGAKGDLELSHASDVSIRGNVHSNGAIYLGSSTLVNTWTATKPSNGPTVIGPDADGNNVFITGVNGIFRLSKPLMFGAINTDDPSWSGFSLTGSPPSGSWTTANAYSLDNKLYPTETTVPAIGSVFSATQQGSVINPYRVKTSSGFVTLPLSGLDDKRTINGTPLIGSGGLANDSRDDERGAKWNPLSLGGPGATSADPSGFKGYARTALTTGRVVRLPNDLTNRPLEAQVLDEVDSDGDPTTDNHEAALPKFRKPDGTDTTDMASLDSTKPVVESPGVYLKYALGSDKSCMARRDDGTGWDITDQTGLPVVDQPKSVGLTIRERQIPLTTMWPGTSGAPVVDPSNPNYLPFAYGKHWRPSNVPYVAMDVVANTSYDDIYNSYSRRGYTAYNSTSDPSAIGSGDAWRDFDMSAANRADSYEGSGVFRIRSAASPGPGYNANGVTDAISSGDSGFWPGQRPAYFFQENWHFLHLKKPVATTTPGVNATYWNDPMDVSRYHQNLNGNQQATLSGPGALARVESNVNLGGTPGSGVNADQFSGRWEGFFIAPSNNTFQFGIVADDEARVWINNTLVVSQPSYQGGSLYQGKSLTLMQGGRYPLVVEFSEGSGGEQAQLQYRVAGGTWSVLPSTQLVTRDPGFGFSWKDFRAIQARVMVTGTPPPQSKIGVMVRPAEGASPLQNGRDGYAAMLFSPTRGFFTQRRIQPAVTDGFQRQSYVNFVGSTTTDSPTQADGAGVVDVNIDVADPKRQAVLTPTGPWTTATSDSGIFQVSRSSTRVNTTVSSAGPGLQTRSNISAGDGTFLDTVYIGPDSGFTKRIRKERQYRSPTYSQWNKSRFGTLVLDMTGHVGPFVAADENRGISIYNANLGNGLWGFWNSWDFVVTDGDTLTHSQYSNTNSQNNAGANGWTGPTLLEDVNDVTVNDPRNNKYIFDPLPKRRNSAGNVITPNPTPAEVVAIMNGLYGGGHVYAGAAPGMPTVADPVDGGASRRPVETGLVNDPGFPALADPWGGMVSRTFSIDRGNTTIRGYQDVNAYVATGAPWYNLAQPAFLPWQSIWSGATVARSVAPVPMTHSFPQTVWRNMTIPRQVPWNTASDVPMTGLVNHSGRWMGDEPAAWIYNPNTSYVVRIERDMFAITPTLKFKYYIGTSSNPSPTDPAWVELPGTAEVQPWLDAYKNLGTTGDNTTVQLLAGLVVQSGDKNIPVDATFADVKIETAASTIDKVVWDASSGGPRDTSRYLASQYQAFWGNYDITEDFFSFGEANSASRLATEDWIFNPREFWSQSRWWDEAKILEKDPWPGYPGVTTAPSGWFSYNDTTNRQLLAKTTLLTLNMRTIQDYLRSRVLRDAVVPVMTNTINGSNLPGPTLQSGLDTQFLYQSFNGLFYAVRTNRYPWNPSPAVENPWGPRGAMKLPNFGPAVNVNYTKLDDTTWANSLAGVNLLQPYGLTQAPPIRPQNFLHAVRIINASSIDWGYSGTPTFGESKTSIVTPNQLFVQGNLNSKQRLMIYKKTPNVMKETPLAIMGDAVVLLSNFFRDADYQATGLNVGNSSIWGNSILNRSGGVVTAAGPGPDGPSGVQATYYTTSILTHNAPTTKASVKEGQGAPFIDTMMFLETWPSGTVPSMQFKGSLVVMNSRRYTSAFLLDTPKTYGRTPLGITGWHKSPADWAGASPPVYSAPFRGFDFNNDLLTEEGTPPFTPFGVTAAGVGGYTTILQ